MIGTTVGHFRILSKIADSGSGEVYRAEDEALRRPVALDVLSPDLASDPGHKARFLSAARAAAAVTHPNLAAIHEVGESDGRVWVAMELVEGVSLRSRLRGRPLPLLEVLRVGEQVAEGLAAAQLKGLGHGDLRPEKVLLGPGGQVKVVELGLAGALPDPPADVYRLGAMLYEMATGEAPRTAAPDPEAPGAEAPRAALSTYPAATPAELDRIIVACLEPDPADRYQDSGEIAADLGRLRRRIETAAVAVPGGGTAAQRGTAWSARRIALWSAAAAVLATAIGFAGWRWIGPLLKPGAPFKPGDRIILADWDIETRDTELAVAIREILEPSLGAPHLKVIEQDLERKDALTRAVLEERCGRGECEGYITGRIVREGAGYLLEAALWRAGRAEPVAKVAQRAADESGLGQGFLDLYDSLSLVFPGAVGETSAPAPAESCPAPWPSIPAIQAWMKAERYQFQNSAEMMSMLKRSLELAPDFLLARSRLALAYLNMGDIGQARVHYAEVVRGYKTLEAQHPACRQPQLYNEILYLHATYDTPAKLERLNRYLQLFPNDGDMRNVMAGTLRGQEDFAAAVPHARRCYELSPIPGHFQGLTGLLNVVRDAAAIETVIAEYRVRDIGGDPRHKEVALALAEVDLAEARGDGYSDIVDLLDRLVAEGRLASRKDIRAGLLFLAGRLREAGEEVARAAASRQQASMKTGQASWPPNQGLLWLEHRRSGKAPVLAPEEIAYLEGNLGRLGRFAVLAVETGETRTLASLIRHHEAAEKDNMTPDVRSGLQFARGCVALIEGRAQEAVTIVAPLARDNEIQRFHHLLGRAHETTGNLAEAARAYEMALRNIRHWGLDPPAILMLDQHRLAQVYERLGNTERARHWYGGFLEVWKNADPGTPEVEDAKRRLAALGGPLPAES